MNKRHQQRVLDELIKHLWQKLRERDLHCTAIRRTPSAEDFRPEICHPQITYSIRNLHYARCVPHKVMACTHTHTSIGTANAFELEKQLVGVVKVDYSTIARAMQEKFRVHLQRSRN